MHGARPITPKIHLCMVDVAEVKKCATRSRALSVSEISLVYIQHTHICIYTCVYIYINIFFGGWWFGAGSGS